MLDHLHNVARLIMRLYGPYLTVSQAITTGMIVCAGITPEAIQRRRDALKW